MAGSDECLLGKTKRIKEEEEEEGDFVSNDDTLEHVHKKRGVPEVGQPDSILLIESRQAEQLLQLDYSSSHVTHVYNPLDYASETHSYYVRQFGNGKKSVMFLGMNPGPFGMAQNGVPFGDVVQVKEWLGVKGHVKKPYNEHPKRPIQGLSITRTEVSGTRFWNLIKSLSVTPERFFENCYVHNYCPLCFMTSSARNVTPPSLKRAERTSLELICDKGLVDIILLLHVETVVCIGKYVERRAQLALQDFKKWKISIGSITHPSPINPAANKGDWIAIATQQLQEMNIVPIIVNEF